MTQPLSAGTLQRARDLREMGAGWRKVAQLTGVPSVVLKAAMHAALWPPRVTRIESDGSIAMVLSTRETNQGS